MITLYSFEEKYQEYLTAFEEYAKKFTETLKTEPSVLAESMKYSLLLGGKRIRPVLALATADVLGVSREDVLPYALAIEMIHTYSLIHDDLPCMDNDDFRRGKPSNHKAFGEANAVLAGDALLNTAYSICFEQCLKGEKYAYASKFLNDCAGIRGMLAGQSADIYYSSVDGERTEKELTYVYACKTGKLLLAPIAIVSILADNKFFLPLENYGKQFGFLFQLTDDILDEVGEFDKLGKTIGKDKEENKLTYIRLYGLDAARMKAEFCASDCHALLEGVDGDTQFLNDLVDYVHYRNK